MTKILVKLKAQPEGQAEVEKSHPGALVYMIVPIAVMSVATVLIGLFGDRF